jgi:hypothetical protein
MNFIQHPIFLGNGMFVFGTSCSTTIVVLLRRTLQLSAHPSAFQPIEVKLQFIFSIYEHNSRFKKAAVVFTKIYLT